MKRLIMGAVVAALVATGCASTAEEDVTTTAISETTAPEAGADDTTVTAPPEQPDESTTTTTRAATTTTMATTTTEPEPAENDSAPETTTTTTTSPPATGEAAEDLVGAITQDLIDRTGASEDDIVVVRSEEVIWNDGSLGCPEPGQTYTDATVTGYWVVLEIGDDTFDYRATANGSFRLCEGSAAPPSNPTG